MNEFRAACRERDAKIDEIAARNVRNGMSPWEAYSEACREVEQVRRAFPKQKPRVTVRELIERGNR